MTPFPLVSLSPWPLFLSFSIFILFLGMLIGVKNSDWLLLELGLSMSCMVIGLWWRDNIREYVYLGKSSSKLQASMSIGFVLFLLSEAMLFFSLFFAFFYYSLSPGVELGSWPPVGVSAACLSSVPIFNTALLLSSGVSVTIAHHALENNRYGNVMYGMWMSILLGFLFLIIQVLEYYFLSFSIADSVYGSIFFLVTGFHGMHVVIGIAFLCVGTYFSMAGMVSSASFLSIELPIWYWHFVDVVWMFVLVSIYWWGS